MAKHNLSIKERLSQNSIPVPECGCLIWLGSVTTTFGYGVIKIKGRVRTTHRASWECENGNIPDNLHVLHKCDIPSCVNPDHLFLGTNDDNVYDKTIKGRVPKGENHWKISLTDEQVNLIRRSTDKTKNLAETYNVSYGAIWQIRNNKRRISK